LPPWRWKQHIPPKCRLIFNGLHGVISQKIELFIIRQSLRYSLLYLFYFISFSKLKLRLVLELVWGL
jgi:hypothetical protein